MLKYSWEPTTRSTPRESPFQSSVTGMSPNAVAHRHTLGCKFDRSPSHYRYRWSASGQHLVLHLFCYVFKNRLLTLRAHVGELDSMAFLVSPDHSPDCVNG